MADLFVSEDGTDIRICKKDEDGRERCICCVGLMGDYLYGEPTEETLAEWRYYARLFAQAEKMKAALEGIIGAVNESRGIAGYHLSGDIAYWDEFEEIDNARVLLAELSEKNREH